MRKIVTYLLVGTMIAGSFLLLPATEAQAFAPKEMSTQKSTGIYVWHHTQDEIRAFAKEHPFDRERKGNVMNIESSMTPPYNSPGKPSEKMIQDGLNAINQIRYTAGIGCDVTLDDNYMKLAQAGAYVNAVNDVMTHYPEKPNGMSDEMFQLGSTGCRSSNIGWGYSTLADAVICGWMDDGDSRNVSRVGHRRWILNPRLAKTGFGYATNAQTGYSAMYAFDDGSTEAWHGVAWPAQNTPIEYVEYSFDKEELYSDYDDMDDIYPWSYSYGSPIDVTNVQVTLTRARDNKQWKFSTTSADGNFYVNNDWYGQPGCIIFQPNDLFRYYADDKFHVEITGLPEPVSYDVNFFSLNESAITKALNDLSINTKSELILGSNATAKIAGEYNNMFKGTLNLKSSNPSIFTIEKNKIVPKKVGTAYLEATYQIGDQTKQIKKKIVVRKPGIVLKKYKKVMKVTNS